MDPTICRLCGEAKLLSTDQQAYGVCAECFHLPGFVKLPPNRRRLKPCRECGAREFIRAPAFERATSGRGSWTDSRPFAAPMAVAFRQTAYRKPGLWGPGEPVMAYVHPDDVMAPVGWLELHICRGCGLVTWYGLEPDRIPIGPEFGTELLTVEDVGPYR